MFRKEAGQGQEGRVGEDEGVVLQIHANLPMKKDERSLKHAVGALHRVANYS